MKMKMEFKVLSWYKNLTFQCGYRIVSLVLQLSHTLDMYKLINTIKILRKLCCYGVPFNLFENSKHFIKSPTNIGYKLDKS